MMQVAVLAGGCSPEHEVSIRSGIQVLAAMDAERFVAWPVFLDRQGAWWPSLEPCRGRVTGFRTPSMRPMRPGAALAWLLDHAGIQLAFPALHGMHGEDGTVQGMLELHGLPHVGSDCRACAIAMDKIHTREILSTHGLALAPAFVPETPLAEADADLEAARIADSIGFPCFLKVDNSGSSLGVARADGPSDVIRFLDECRGMGRRFFAEAPVEGREVTIAVLGNCGAELQALPPVGIEPAAGEDYFNYEAKYTPGRCHEVVPPPGLDARQILELQEIGLACHRALQCDGLSRSDVILGPDGPVVLEVNTMPGLTQQSLLPKAARAAGMDFPDLVHRLLELALSRSHQAEVLR